MNANFFLASIRFNGESRVANQDLIGNLNKIPLFITRVNIIQIFIKLVKKRERIKVTIFVLGYNV